jgi:SP family sugar:H+ symporter-like MFS transporter
LGTASNWLWNFLIVSIISPICVVPDRLLIRVRRLQAFFTPFITREINYGYGFVFAGCNLAAAVFTYFFLYESSGISLEMIDAMYSEPGLKPWQSGKWAPEVSRNGPDESYRSISPG